MLERFLPSRDAFRNSHALRWLGPRMHHPSLWHFGRRAVARGAAIGAFFGLLIPVAQIPAAVLVGLLARANLWVAAMCTFVTNPFTYGPLYYAAYRLGSRFTDTSGPIGDPASASETDHALAWLLDVWAWFTEIGRPLAVGLLLMAIAAAALGYVAVLVIWRKRVLRRRRQALLVRALRNGD